MIVINYNSWFISYVIFFSCFCLKPELSLAAEKISADQILSGDQTVSSKGGNFVLGFFKPGNSSNYYVGIWYNRVSPQTIVWVANREEPVLDKYYSELRISNGNLALFNESGIVIWSTNLSPMNSTSLEAKLLEEGNLVLQDGPNSSEPLWESFDHPTDTWLPGGRLGLNKNTRESTRLTSWKNNDDPAPGLYSVEIDPYGTSQYYILWNRSKIMWTSGTWNGHIFSLIPEMSLNYVYNFSYVSNDFENYFTYSLYNNSIISRFLISLDGQIQQQSWLHPPKKWSLFWSQPRVQCQIYAYCGAFASCDLKSFPFCHCLEGFQPKSVDDWNSGVYSAGCERKTSLPCGNSSQANEQSDRFLARHSVRLPVNPWTVAPQKCESTCLNNCSCTAYAYSGINCTFWSGDLLNIQQLEGENSNGETLYVRLAASELSTSNNKKRKIIGLVIVLGSGVILVLIILFLILRRMRMSKLDKELGSMPDITTSAIANGGGQNDAQLVIFSFKTILAATDDFSQANKLGEGGFGPVYKVSALDDHESDQEAAVKRLSRQSGQGLEEFMNELKLIANLQHKYLVRLLGCCVERDEKILIYEYMANRSLDKFLYDPSERIKLVWDKRLKIAEGVAQGLLYIHKFSRLKVIHRDLKASNILLDEEMNPKISDFGMARIFGTNQTEANTNRVMGTYGYMSPEYAFSGQFSEKSDVFSFGVCLLETVSGRRNTSFHRSGLSFTLLSWAWELWKEGKEEELIDASIKDTCRLKEAVKCIHVGLLCVQEDPIHRPTMSLVVFMLSSDTQTLPSPKEPAFLTRRAVDCSTEGCNECSNNKLTISLPEGR